MDAAGGVCCCLVVLVVVLAERLTRSDNANVTNAGADPAPCPAAAAAPPAADAVVGVADLDVAMVWVAYACGVWNLHDGESDPSIHVHLVEAESTPKREPTQAHNGLEHFSGGHNSLGVPSRVLDDD